MSARVLAFRRRPTPAEALAAGIGAVAEAMRDVIVMLPMAVAGALDDLRRSMNEAGYRFAQSRVRSYDPGPWLRGDQ